jgi:hypothetical protein
VPDLDVVSLADRLFARSRAARYAVILVLWPFVVAADRLRGVDRPVSLAHGLRWAHTGFEQHKPATPPVAQGQRRDHL